MQVQDQIKIKPNVAIAQNHCYAQPFFNMQIYYEKYFFLLIFPQFSHCKMYSVPVANPLEGHLTINLSIIFHLWTHNPKNFLINTFIFPSYIIYYFIYYIQNNPLFPSLPTMWQKFSVYFRLYFCPTINSVFILQIYKLFFN